ncbi:hypothetical protein KUTeg_024228 [Tegillarca granosa]|uniref:Uncharacterized protein n=1 Tax=Tegillarca granosa TaxID=220873 RepID=A0ABQ9DXF5_TEGGR|nr:hypothetical protein KUTeg_024228 [Tegillarca granosa]
MTFVYFDFTDSRAQSRLTRRSDRTESRVEELPVDDLLEKGLSPSQQPAASPAGPFDISPSPRTVTDHLSCNIPDNDHKLSTDSDKADIADTETAQSTVNTEDQGEKSEEKVTEEQNVSERNIEELEEELVSRTPRTIDVIQEEESEEGSVPDQALVNDNGQIPTTKVFPEGLRHPYQYHEDLDNGDVHIEVTAIPSTGRVPTPPTDRSVPLQELSKSDIWNFTPDVGNPEDSDTENEEVEIENEENTENKKRNPYLYHRGEHWTKAIVKPENYCFGCLPDSMSTKVGRSAGRMPGRSQSASAQVLRMSKKQNDYFSRAPPLRTPPSIPSPYHQSYGRSPRYGETYNSELERHARTVKSPRHFMEHVGDLRKEIRSAPTGSYFGSNDLLSSTLHVCKLDLPSRSNTELEFNTSSSTRDELPFTLTCENTFFSDKTMENDGQNSRPTSGKHVGFDIDSENVVKNGDNIVTNGDNVETSDVTNGDVNNTEVQSSEQSPGDETGNQGVSGETTTSHSTKQTSIAHIGRPIPQVSNIHDPEEEAMAAQIQREAKAAVDIQRIFRGYVARSNYKKLISTERYKMEDERKAALEQQRQHKAHVERTQAIYNRPAVSQEQKEWANTYKEIRDENAKVRERKMEELAEQLHNNHQQASSKISVIGPHVEIYQVYHPKQTGPTKKELEDAAIQIQKHMRGFVVRKKFEKLKRKAQWHGSTFRKMVKDYKGTLSRCQTRHGVEKPSTPFTFKDMNEYMDARRHLEQFFRECDLYPSASEIEEALDVVLHATRNMKRGLQKKDILECIFYIYVPRITGLTDTRHSTWLNPIIDGVEARKLLGSDIVEPAPLEVCAKLVIDSKRERRDKEKLEAEKLHKEQLAARKAKRKAKKSDPNTRDDMSDTSSNEDR